MAIARYKDLCFDVVDPEVMGPFWAGALGLDIQPGDGDAVPRLVGPTPQHTVWLNPVPEPVTVAQWVHPDVYAASVDDVLALGATPKDLDSHRWKILRDPEGGEVCVFEREPDRLPAYRLYELGVNCHDPLTLTAWWAEAFGVEARSEDAHGGWYGWVEGVPGMPFESIDFVPVPESKTVKNRVHWDVDVDDLTALVAHGATVLREPGAYPEGETHWTVLADPEGNEFCAFTADD